MDPKKKMWEAIPCPTLYTNQVPASSLPKCVLLDTLDGLQNLEDYIVMHRLHEEKPIKYKSIEKIKELAQIFSPQRKRNNRSTVKISKELLSSDDSNSLLSTNRNEPPDVNLLSQIRTEISGLHQKYNELLELENNPDGIPRELTQVLLSPPNLTEKPLISYPSQPNQPSLVSRVSFRLSPYVRTIESSMKEPEHSESLKHSGKKRKCSEERKIIKQPLRFSSSTHREHNLSPILSRTSSAGELPSNKENQHPQSPRSPSKIHRKSLLSTPILKESLTTKEKSTRVMTHNRSVSIDQKNGSKLFQIPLEEIPSIVSSPQKFLDRAKELKKRLESISPISGDTVDSTPFVV